MRLEPINIQQVGDELAIAWNDGTESFLKLELLRRACPCAACGGEPDVLGNTLRPHAPSRAGFGLRLGRYACKQHELDGEDSDRFYLFLAVRRGQFYRFDTKGESITKKRRDAGEKSRSSRTRLDFDLAW